MEKRNLYKEITDRIIDQLEKGTIPWHKPWIIRGDGVGIVSHSTGAPKRLDRKTIKDYSTDKSVRATEELIAEIGAATSLMMLGIDTDKSMLDSASYIKSWLRFLKDDPKMVVSAAGKAEKAVDMIWNIKHEAKQEA